MRYSETEKKLFIFWDGREYLHADFNQPDGTTYTIFTFFWHNYREVEAIKGNDSIFKLNREYVGYFLFDGFSGIEVIFDDSIGIISDALADNYLTKIYELVGAITHFPDSNSVYFSYHYKPGINISPVTFVNSENFELVLTVNHDYTRILPLHPLIQVLIL